MGVADIRNFTLDRGKPWKRIVYLLDRRTRRRLMVDSAQGGIKTNDLGGYVPLTVTVSSSGGLVLTLDADTNIDLPLGDLPYDVVATVQDQSDTVVKGTITVYQYDSITRGDEDTTAMILSFAQRTDYYRNLTWRNEDGTVAQVYDAFMQAKDGTGATVLDLRWFVAVPTEQTIQALPATQRGYLASGYPDCSLLLHVSDMNTVPAGEYVFDLFTKDGAGHWDKTIQGTLVVEASVSEPPA